MLAQAAAQLVLLSTPGEPLRQPLHPDPSAEALVGGHLGGAGRSPRKSSRVTYLGAFSQSVWVSAWMLGHALQGYLCQRRRG